MGNAPIGVGKGRLRSVTRRRHRQRVRGDGVAMGVIERITQERNIAFLFILTDVVLHAVRTLVPLCRIISRMFRQILFINAVSADQFQSRFSTFLCEHKLFACVQHTSECQVSHGSSQRCFVHVQTTHRFAHFLTGQTTACVADILQKVFTSHGLQIFMHFDRRTPHFLAKTMPQTLTFHPYFV